MKIVLKIIFMALFWISEVLMASSERGAQLNFEVPEKFYSDHYFPPASYLEQFSVPMDTELNLNKIEAQNLACLFVASGYVNYLKYNQDYSISKKVNLYLLLQKHFNFVSDINNEYGTQVSLIEVALTLQENGVNCPNLKQLTDKVKTLDVWRGNLTFWSKRFKNALQP